MFRNILVGSMAVAIASASLQAYASEEEASKVQDEVVSAKAEDSASFLQEEAVTLPLSVFDKQQTMAIEDIIHDYLIEHPEILIEMSQKLQQKQMVAQEEKNRAVINEILNDPDLPVEGNPDAKHYLIEFFDYNCGYCKSARKMMYRLAEEVDLKVYYIEMPVLSQMSVKASAYGLALFNQDREKYLEYQKYLMSKKERLTDMSQIQAAVEHVGADFDALSEIVTTDPKVQDALRKNMELGERLEMQGVPLFILDGYMIKGAIKDYDALKEFLKTDE